MAFNIDEAKQTFYDAEVKSAYLKVGVLNGTTREKPATPGKEVQFRKSGTVSATEHQPHQRVAGAGAKVSAVLCPLKAWEAFDYVDEFDPKTINFDELKELAQICSNALGCRRDQIKIDAMADGVDETNMIVGDKSKAMSLAVLKDAKYKLDKNDVPFEGRYFVYHPYMLRGLLDETQFTSNDFVEKRQLADVNAGTGKVALGFEFKMFADKGENIGLPKSGEGASRSVRGFVWHKDAIGYASQKDITTSIDWIPDYREWLVGGTFNAGAVVIDDRGVVGIDCLLGQN